jgi:hypothetical protein
MADGAAKLPYNVDKLSWDVAHHFNSQNKYGYTGKGRRLGDAMLQCETCLQWFPAREVSSHQTRGRARADRLERTHSARRTARAHPASSVAELARPRLCVATQPSDLLRQRHTREVRPQRRPSPRRRRRAARRVAACGVAGQSETGSA